MGSPATGGGAGSAEAEFVIRDTEAPSKMTVFAVAATTDSELDELRPLQEVIDPESLDTAVGPTGSDLTVEFSYEGCTVRVDGDRVRVSRGTASRSAP